MGSDLMKFLAYYLIPVCMDIGVISYMLTIKNKERLVVAALVVNGLVFLVRDGFKKLITSIIQPFFINIGTDLQIKYMGAIEKVGTQLIIIVGLLIAIAIRIPFYKKFINSISTKEVSLAVFISSLVSEVIIAIGLFIFMYNIHP